MVSFHLAIVSYGLCFHLPLRNVARGCMQEVSYSQLNKAGTDVGLYKP